MRVLELSHCTWEEIRELDGGRTVAILPVGAVEAHGPHLPLGADVVIAEAMARAGAEKLALRGYAGLLLPPLAYTSAAFAAGFPGTVSLSPATVTGFVVDLARNLTRQGFAALALANAHLDPGHLASLAAAVAAAQKEKLLRVAFPDLSKKPWGSRLTDEFKSGACHAGRFESSIVMAARPERVRESIRKSLPSIAVSLSEAIQGGKHTFEEAGGARAYFGFPADATPEEGRQTIEILGGIIEEAVLAELDR